MRLKDKVVLVTASTRGIGLACVKACELKTVADDDLVALVRAGAEAERHY